MSVVFYFSQKVMRDVMNYNFGTEWMETVLIIIVLL